VNGRNSHSSELAVARHLALATYMLVAGIVGGWLVCWPASLLEMRLTGAGYSGTNPHWDLEWATFFANWHGAPFGGFFGLIGYIFFLHKLSSTALIRAFPILYLYTLLGALLGCLGGPFGQLILSGIAFFVACKRLVSHPKHP
jgi:hypothetical protein